MNTKQTGKLLSAFVSATQRQGFLTAEPPLSLLAKCLETLPPKPMNSFLKRTGELLKVGSASNTGKSDKRTKVIKNDLNALIQILELCAKSGSLKSVNSLLTFVEDNNWMNFDSILRAMSKTTEKSVPKRSGKPKPESSSIKKSVQKHISDLKRAEKDQKAFSVAFAQLKADKSILKPQLKQIADELSGFSQKGTKAQLYEAVERRHRYYFDAIARQKAAGNKSAA